MPRTQVGRNVETLVADVVSDRLRQTMMDAIAGGPGRTRYGFRGDDSPQCLRDRSNPRASASYFRVAAA
jgi:hypothetical protein